MIYEIEMPDGSILEAEVPEGTPTAKVETAAAEYWQHKSSPTLMSTAAALKDKADTEGYLSAGWDIAKGIPSAVGGVYGETPEFLVGLGRKGAELAADTALGEDVGDPAVKAAREQRVLDASKNEALPGAVHALSEWSAPEGETGKFLKNTFGEGMQAGLSWGSESALQLENARRSVLNSLQEAVGMEPGTVPGTTPLTPEEQANIREWLQFGMEAGMAGALGKGFFKKGKPKEAPKITEAERGEVSSLYPDGAPKTPTEMVRETLGLDITRDPVPEQQVVGGTPKQPPSELIPGRPQGPSGEVPALLRDPTKPQPPNAPPPTGLPPEGPVPYLMMKQKSGKGTEVEVGSPAPEMVVKTAKEVDIPGNELTNVESGLPGVRPQRIAAMIDSIYKGDTKSVIGVLAEHNNPIIKAFAQLMQRMENFQPKIILTETIPAHLRGVYKADTMGQAKIDGFFDPTTNTVYVRSAGRQIPLDQLVMHELTHAAVSIIQQSFETGHHLSGRFRLTREQQAAAAQIQRLWKFSKEHYNAEAFDKPQRRGTPNQFTNSHEFIADALSDYGFQRWMAAVKLPGSPRTMWAAFVDAVRDIFNIQGKDMTLLEQVLEASEALISSSDHNIRSQYIHLSGVELPKLAAAAKAKGRELTNFEKEEGLIRGAGSAVADLEAPLKVRLDESLQIGKDLTAGSVDAFFGRLPNDISWAAKTLLNPVHLAKYAENNPLLGAFIDRVQHVKTKFQNLADEIKNGQTKAMEAYKDHKSIPNFQHYITRTGKGFRSISEAMEPSKQQELFRAFKEFENDGYLIENEMKRPDKALLKARGYSDIVADAYLQEVAYLDAALEAINIARKRQGMEPIGYVPGYMPHSYQGHMAIRIKARNAQGEEFTMAFTRARGASRKKLAALAAEVTEQAKRDMGPSAMDLEILPPEIYRVDRASGAADLIDSMTATAEVFGKFNTKFGKAVHKTLNQRIDAMERSFLGHMKTRNNVRGWIGSMVEPKVKDMVNIREQYIMDALKYAEATEIRHKTTAQLSYADMDVLRQKLPQTYDFITKFEDVARERFPLNSFDRFVLDAFSQLTNDRFSYRAPLMGLQKIRGFFAIKDLSWSLSYHTGNLIQPYMFGAVAMAREAARMGKGNYVQALARAEYELWKPSPETKGALLWAAENKTLVPKLMQEVGIDIGAAGAERWGRAGGKFSKAAGRTWAYATEMFTGRKASEMNEAYGRARSYVAGYLFYRDAGLSKAQARTAAAKLTNDIMVDYSPTGQPLWLSNNPGGAIAGRLVAPYAAFRHAYWGHTALAFQALKRNPTLIRQYMPILQMQFMTGLMAGLRGTAFMAELNMIWSAFNAWYEDTYNEKSPFPSPEKVMVEAGLSDHLMFGAVAGITGIDVSTTMAAPSVGEFITPRAVEGSIDVLSHANTFAKVMFGDATEAEKLEAIKAISPSHLHGVWELVLHPLSDQYKLGDFPEVSADSSRQNKGGVVRNDMDWYVRSFTGKRTVREQRQNMLNRDLTMAEKTEQGMRGKWVEQGADQLQMKGYVSPELIEKAINSGYEYLEFMTSIDNAVEQRKNSALQRKYHVKNPKQRHLERQRLIDEALPGVDLSNYQY